MPALRCWCPWWLERALCARSKERERVAAGFGAVAGRLNDADRRRTRASLRTALAKPRGESARGCWERESKEKNWVVDGPPAAGDGPPAAGDGPPGHRPPPPPPPRRESAWVFEISPHARSRREPPALVADALVARAPGASVRGVTGALFAAAATASAASAHMKGSAHDAHAPGAPPCHPCFG